MRKHPEYYRNESNQEWQMLNNNIENETTFMSSKGQIWELLSDKIPNFKNL